MTFTRLLHGYLVIPASFALALSACENSPSDVRADPALNGAWVDGVQTGAVKVYITELRFNNGSFQSFWDGDLQERSVYDTQDGILTITVQNSYGGRGLGNHSSRYSIVGNTLTLDWRRYTKK